MDRAQRRGDRRIGQRHRPAPVPARGALTLPPGPRYTSPCTGTADGRRRAGHYLASGLADGTLRPVIGEVFDGLDRIVDAHRLMESSAHTGKIVVRI